MLNFSSLLLLAFTFHGTTAFMQGPVKLRQLSELFGVSRVDNEDDTNKNQAVSSRRAWIDTSVKAAGLLAATETLVSRPTRALDADFQKYGDQACNFQINLPATWQMSEQQLPDRRKIVLFIDPNDRQTLFFAAFTPIRDDFPSLSSFGSVDQVAQATVLPRGQIQGEETSSTLISAESKKNAYFFDYTAKPPQLPEAHYRVIFSLAQGATGGAGAVLVTLTAQTPTTRYDEMKGLLDQIIDSYGKYTG